MRNYSTRQRKAMLDYLISHKDEPVCAEQIAGELQGSGISISAVYRNLTALEKDGKVAKSSKDGSRRIFYRYIDAEACRGHLHLSCRQCGKTYHMDVPATESLVMSVQKDSGFCVDRSSSVLYGVCGICRSGKRLQEDNND